MPQQPVILAAPDARGGLLLARLEDGVLLDAERFEQHRLASAFVRLGGATAKWVVQDARAVLPHLRGAGVRVDRLRELRLSHRILAGAGLLAAEARWLRGVLPNDDAMFSLEPEPASLDELAAELARQDAAVAAAPTPGRIELLLRLESTGALIAFELGEAGLPWSSREHDAILTEHLGTRPAGDTGRPAVLESLANELRVLLRTPELNPDAPAEVLAALRRGGLDVHSTSRWELRGKEHAAIGPLLEYKKLARLWTANGWKWASQWVRDGRLRTEYVPAGVVTGRWATNGGGAMQLPKLVRAAAVADEGKRLVVADASQLEPRVLAAMARDLRLAEAGRDARGEGVDLYQGLVDAGVVATREQAKYATLGALYGATSGKAGELAPQLSRAYPVAMGVVDAAAAMGQRGKPVSTWLGRTSPPAPWLTDSAKRTAQLERSWGRFTRNFVVQGSAAEWALAWMGLVRAATLPLGGELVYFLHDEIVLQVPEQHAAAAAAAVQDAATKAGALLFGSFPVVFPVRATVASDYASAAH